MKKKLREALLAARAGLDTKTLSQAACARLADFLAARGAGRIMLYLPFRNELNPLPLVDLYPAAEYFLPRISGGKISVHPFDSPRERHPYGFIQPADVAKVVEPATLEAIVTPGLAFDRSCYRLGYGGGYYDRLLADLPDTVTTIGFAPKAMLQDSLPHDEWDVPVQFLASETGVQACK